MSSRVEIVFIDASIANSESFLSAISPDAQVVWLNSASDGLDQIASYLEGKTNIDAVHVISHGSAGQLNLGASVVNEESLVGYATDLAKIKAALSETADFLLYGCDVASGDVGTSFINALADATGADVAASIDATGSSAVGGDSVLEVATGEINTPTIDFSAYDHTLGASVTYSFSSSRGSSGSPAYMNASNVWYTSGGTLTVNAYDVDWAGERDRLDISYNGGATWHTLTNTYGDGYLRGWNNSNSTTVYTLPNFTGVDGFVAGGTLRLRVVCETSGWVFAVNATTLSVFTNNKPTAQSSTVYLDEDTRYTFTAGSFYFSDSDNNDSFVKVKITSIPSSGSLTLNGVAVSAGQEIAAGSLSGLRYTPVANYFGTQTFGFQVHDGWEWSASTYTMTLSVASVNDAPALASSIMLMPMEEDQANNPGVSLSSRFATYFTDVENGAGNMTGVVVVGTTADAATEGSWQYYAGGAWHNIDANVVSTSHALALTAATLIRFNPVLNYSGTPPTLNLLATDANFSLASYANGTPVNGNYVDTTTAPLTAGISAVQRTVGIIVLPSNDAPTFTPSTTITGGVQDTYKRLATNPHVR